MKEIEVAVFSPAAGSEPRGLVKSIYEELVRMKRDEPELLQQRPAQVSTSK